MLTPANEKELFLKVYRRNSHDLTQQGGQKALLCRAEKHGNAFSNMDLKIRTKQLQHFFC